jgi:UDP-N-acetylglucosamine 2-epimerase (non-hydrolysing)
VRKIKVLTIFGTRPEAIKMAPLCIALSQDARFEARICLSGQHREMLDQMLGIFNIKGHYDLNVMRQGQDLTELSSKILEGLQPIIKNFRPDICLVHGDTTTSMAASLSSFYLKTPIGHVEAGLRTNNLFSPWPEEGNRRINSALSTLHFAPSEESVNNLLAEGINQKSIILTGNTVIDALNIAVKRLNSNPLLAEELSKQFSFLGNNRKMLLVTGHRRENIGIALDALSRALAIIAKKYPSIDIVYTMHMNPAVQISVKKHLGCFNNVYLIGPQDYMAFIYLMKRSTLILTDSGGIQEEAPALGKPVLVFRETTERPEGVRAGCAKLIGVEDSTILAEVERLITNESERIQMSQVRNPYGDGLASGRIIDSLVKYFKEAAATSK